ncbi:unnamed protein product [Dovyalis caffra]|uniref:Uncharacterized protein n=1 Tax=Dovyalis caffra TaxID=77055 RepID=A0AAV1RZL4_9ROSI|nr:unnamed protein product [Dovyalis caffra]
MESILACVPNFGSELHYRTRVWPQVEYWSPNLCGMLLWNHMAETFHIASNCRDVKVLDLVDSVVMENDYKERRYRHVLSSNLQETSKIGRDQHVSHLLRPDIRILRLLVK